MFEFFDKETPEVCRRLFARAAEIDARYLRVPLFEAADLVRADFSDLHRFISDREISFRYDDLDFDFTIAEIGQPIVSAHGNGRYNGFMLQSSAEDRSWFTNVSKPGGQSQGARAQALADCFEKQFGVRNLGRLLGHHRW